MSIIQRYSTKINGWEYVDEKKSSGGSNVSNGSGGYVSGGYGNGYNHTSMSTYAACHHKGDVVLFDIDGLDVLAAEKPELPKPCTKDEFPNTLFVNCTGTEEMKKVEARTIVKKVPELLVGAKLDDLAYAMKYGEPADELLLEWSDRSMPMIQPVWWRELPKAAKAAGYKAMVVFCYGGHGRTGTALASLLLANGIEKNPDAAGKWVKKNHCDKAIESNEQWNYIDWVAGKLCGWKPVKK